ncbi:MAG: hypothetical protein ACO260_10860 [Hylemonella sp.]|jgi:hypothetical protein
MIAFDRAMITKLYKFGQTTMVLNDFHLTSKWLPSPMKPLNILVFIALMAGSQGQALSAPEQGGDARPRPERPKGSNATDQSGKQDDARQRDAEHRPPKLSPEERKALRQQIHEVGHDLYPAKR